MSSAASPIDWGRAERIAVRIANRRPAPAGEPVAGAHDIGAIEDQIEEVTGLRSLAGPAQVHVIDRTEWIQANIASFQRLLAPLFERWQGKQRAGGPAAAVTRQIAGAEFGAMLGWMSTRVLGQYDLLVGRDTPAEAFGTPGTTDDSVYLVGPNLASIEQRYGFDPAQFRTWVLLHELTHRAQFTGVPWMREHFTGLVDQSLSFVDPDPKALVEAVKEALRNREEALRHVRDNGVIGLIAGPEQRAVIARIGGLMSLLEGHGDITMTRAAGELVPSAERFARVLRERRRRSNPMARVVQRLTGIEAKLNQYAAGERFINAVEAAAGRRAIDRCWDAPANIPSLDEIRTPSHWLHRVGALVA